MSKLLLKGSLVRKIFLTYFTLFVLVLFTIGMLNYVWTSHVVYNQTKEMNMLLLSKMNDSINNEFDELDALSNVLTNVAFIRKMAFMNGDGIDFSRIGQVELTNRLNELQLFSGNNFFLSDFAIYLNQKDLFLSPWGYENSAWFFNHNYNFTNMNDKDWVSIMNSMSAGNEAVIYNPMYVTRYFKDQRVIVYLKVLPLIEGKPRATLFAVVNEDRVKQLVAEATYGISTSTYVLDNDNNVVSSVNANPNFDKVVHDKAVSDNSGELSQYEDAQGEKHFAFYISSDEGPGWKYVTFVPVDKVMSEANSIKNITILSSIVLLVLGILFCYRFTLMNYRPVKKLAQMIKESIKNVPLEGQRNEYNLIETGIRDMSLMVKQNQEKMKEFSSIAIHNEFMSLIKGDELSDQDKIECPHICEIYDKPLFAVAIFDEGEFPKQLPETFADAAWIAYRLKHGSQAVCIINMDELDIMEHAIDVLKSYFTEKVTIGIGKTCELRHLRHSYDEAYIAIDSKLIKGESGMIRFSDLSLRNERTYFFPVNFQQDLFKQAKIGDITILRKSLNESVKGMLAQSNLSISIDRHLFYKQVAVCIQELPDHKLADLIGLLQERLSSTATTDEVQAYVERFYKQICEETKQDRENQKCSQDLIGQVLEYIGEHYTETTMSLTMLADAFNMSSPQMSSFFKEQTGESYLDYISKLRIGLAKNILSEGKLKVEDVSRQVGYESVITFRRVFKKYVKQTPTEYKSIS